MECIIAKRADGTFEKVMYPDADNPGPFSYHKRAVLTTATDGHTHLLLMDDKRSDVRGTTGSNETFFEGLSTPGEDGHQHPWVMTPAGKIKIGEANGHTHEAAAVSTTLRDAAELARQGGRARARSELRRTSAATQTSEQTKEAMVMKQIEDLKKSVTATEPADPGDLHHEAGAILDDVTEKHRAKGETHADACKRLTVERSDAGDEYRKAATLADRLHRQAQEEACHPGERFTVTKRFADNTCEVDVRKSAAEQEMDRLVAELRTEEPRLDYYAAYAKAAERYPDVYGQAVDGEII
jgi:hypothetical protein